MTEEKPEELEEILMKIRELARASPVINNDDYINNIPYSNCNFPSEKDEAIVNDFSDDFLDKLLNGESSQRKREIIEHIIKQREELKNKKLQELQDQKSNLRDLRLRALYGSLPGFNEINSLYAMMDQLAIDEEIKSWKDISFLQLKLLEESGLTDNDENDERDNYKMEGEQK